MKGPPCLSTNPNYWKNISSPGGWIVKSEIGVRDLVRITNGDTFVRATYLVREGLVGSLRLHGDKLFGRVWNVGTYPARLQLHPPFEGKCACPEGGGCSHVAAVGLAHLYEQTEAVCGEELIYHRVMTSLDEHGLRGLAAELLAHFEGAPRLAADFLLRHEVANMGLHPATDELDAQKVWERFRTILGAGMSNPERLPDVDRQIRILFKAVLDNGSPEFRMIAMAGISAELAAAIDNLMPFAYRWRLLFHQALEQVVQLMARRTWPNREETTCLRQILNGYSAAGDFTARHLKAALLNAAHAPELRGWLEGESKRAWRAAQGTRRKRLRALLKEVADTKPAREKRTS